MKMMKTEMEFVTFDAQDVIATSGGITDVYYLTGICEYPTRLMGYGGVATDGLTIGSGGQNPELYYITGIQEGSIQKFMNGWYTGTATTESVSGISSKSGYENANQHPIDIATIGDYAKVIEWLTEFTNGLGTRGIQ